MLPGLGLQSVYSSILSTISLPETGFSMKSFKLRCRSRPLGTPILFRLFDTESSIKYHIRYRIRYHVRYPVRDPHINVPKERTRQGSRTQHPADSDSFPKYSRPRHQGNPIKVRILNKRPPKTTAKPISETVMIAAFLFPNSLARTAIVAMQGM